VPVVLVALAVAGMAWPLIAAVKMLFVLWVMTAIFAVIRHRKWHNRHNIRT
jgi:hypothetical protein